MNPRRDAIEHERAASAVKRSCGWAPLLPMVLLSIAAIGGCGPKPSAANIELRKQVVDLEQEIDRLRHERDADRATIRALQADRPTTQSLPQDRLDELFTVAGIRLGRLIGGLDSDQQPGDEAVRVYLAPFDATGDVLKAAGAVVVEAFDLSSDALRLGRWSFDVATTRAAWNSSGLLYEYVLDCPLEKVAVPSSGELTLRVTFTDALTGRSFSAQQLVRVRPR